MTIQRLSEERALDAIDHSQRGGSIGLVVVVALVLIGATLAILLIGRNQAQPYVLILLTTLAVIGVFSLFAIAAGLLRAPGREGATPLLKSVLDNSPEGLLLTDAAGRIVYANPAYLRLVDAADANDVRSVERAG